MERSREASGHGTWASGCDEAALGALHESYISNAHIPPPAMTPLRACPPLFEHALHLCQPRPSLIRGRTGDGTRGPAADVLNAWGAGTRRYSNHDA